MQYTFTTQDAQVLYGFLASALVPLIVGWISRVSWPAWARFALAALVSLLMAALSQYAAGALSAGSFVMALVGVFVASQTFFATWFKSLGFERWLNPDMPAEAKRQKRYEQQAEERYAQMLKEHEEAKARVAAKLKR